MGTQSASEHSPSKADASRLTAVDQDLHSHCAGRETEASVQGTVKAPAWLALG